MNLFILIFRLVRKVILICIGFAMGIVCSMLFYEFVISETGLFEVEKKERLHVGTAIFLSIGFAFSRQVRCIAVLTIPEFASKAGRRAMQVTIIILIISGPIKNIADNGEETVRFLGCIKDMLLRILMGAKDLVLEPIKAVLNDLKTSQVEESYESRYNISELRKWMKPLETEIEDLQEVEELKEGNDEVDEAEGLQHRSDKIEAEYAIKPDDNKDTKIEKTYKKKLAYRCEDIFSQGAKACVDTFKRKYDECYEKITVYAGWALCWPMKIDFICDFLRKFTQGDLCDLNDVIDDGFGESYSVAKKGIEDFSQIFRISVNYTEFSGVVDLEGLKQTRDELLSLFISGREYVEWYLGLLKKALAFSYIVILFGAFKYHWNYLTNLSTDNIYITKYFRKIDARRRREDRETLLPLKSFERPNFSRLNRIGLTEKESRKFQDLFVALIIQAGVVLTIFGFDYLYTELLGLLQKHAEINIKQTGQHTVRLRITGQGLLAKILRVVVNEIDVHHTLDVLHETKPCLPNPRHTPKSYWQRVALLFLLLLTNAFFQAHFTRFRHCIANFFYPDRAKKRVVWLYNETMRRRIAKESHLKQATLENADKFRTHVSRNPLVWMADSFPKACRCLRRCKIGRRKCVVCRKNGEVYRCPDCGYSYCRECYKDLVKHMGCVQCLARKELEDRKMHLYDQD